MKRRNFIKSVVASIAAAPLVIAGSEPAKPPMYIGTPSKVNLPEIKWRKINEGIPVDHILEDLRWKVRELNVNTGALK